MWSSSQTFSVQLLVYHQWGRSAEVNNRFTSAKIIGEWIPTEPVDCGMGSEEWREESEFGDRRKEVGNIISQFVFIATDEEGVNI